MKRKKKGKERKTQFGKKERVHDEFHHGGGEAAILISGPQIWKNQ